MNLGVKPSILVKYFSWIVGLLIAVNGFSQPVFINEVSYLVTTPATSGFEIAGPVGTDLNGWTVELRDENGQVYDTHDLSGTLGNVIGCADFIWVDIILTIQSGGGLTLLDASDAFVQYLTYDGTTTGSGGAADGIISEDIGTQLTAVNSLQLTSNLPAPPAGDDYTDFIWELPGLATKGLVNIDQVPDFCVPLPVEWGDFNGKVNRQQQTLLTWQTFSETNTDFFLIEHSTNGRDFTSIGHMESANNSVIIQEYEFIHDKPSRGTNYYRLKQVDLDGSFEYSTIISVELSFDKVPVVIYPNPVVSTLKLDIDPTLEIHSIQIFELSGDKLLEYSGKVDQIDVSDLPEGVYILKITTPQEVYSELLMIGMR